MKRRKGKMVMCKGKVEKVGKEYSQFFHRTWMAGFGSDSAGEEKYTGVVQDYKCTKCGDIENVELKDIPFKNNRPMGFVCYKSYFTESEAK